ncbi:MAG: beta-lactamase family protein [Acidobacteria bacterium]|nr:beta-lactamase family protein [Acidobacteriota bacterium]
MLKKNVRCASASLLITLFVLGSLTPLSGQERPQREAQTLGLRRMPRGLTQAKIKAHVIEPAHTKDVEMEADSADEVAYTVAKKPKVRYGAKKPTLNVEEFAADLHSVLSTLTAGYVMEVRQNGSSIFATGAGWAQTPNDRSVGWTVNTRMHIASASKFLTAVGLVKLLDSKGISYDEKIINHLPPYWSKGPNVDKITFRHLLNHKSGFGGLPVDSGGKRSDPHHQRRYP